MIKNIIFDMGNVLLDYDPEVSLKHFLEKEEDRAIIRRELFGGPEWKLGDRGDITPEEQFERIAARIPKHLHAALQNCIDEWDMCMKPIPGAREFCDYVKEQGYGVYVLSNADYKFYRYFPNFKPFDFFDGIVVSSDIHIIKPAAGIYEYLLDKYQLTAEECLFIDDRPENIAAAEQLGIQGCVFERNYEEIRERFIDK